MTTLKNVSLLMLLCSICVASQSEVRADNGSRIHPYAYPPVAGHASVIPGSPKHFVPAYGYVIPQSTSPQLRYQRLSPYSGYAFGIRQPLLLDWHTATFLNSASAGPWYHPGWPGSRLYGP